ncbi:hypothetical protein EYF80_033617 [Liparis tanakae]|uniref:Uncharacterized protein n=1 Tax=Liparis tanakae TaxID=230148 RepID=A0A4Z2GTU4_9TELE|nr:hypothetical protein EYF80_033617 [Liparis tanakae]
MGLMQVEDMASRWQRENSRLWWQMGRASWFQSETTLKMVSGSQQRAKAVMRATSMMLMRRL